MKYTEKDIEILALTLYGEARGSTDLDKIGVASVILNRAKYALAYKNSTGKPHPLYGDGSLARVCLIPYQFSCWNKNDPNFKLLEKLNVARAVEADQVFKRCYQIAKEFSELHHSILDITHGSTHYHAKSMAFPKTWGKEKLPAASIGGHYYYNNIEQH